MTPFKFNKTILTSAFLIFSSPLIASPSLDKFYLGVGGGYAHFNGLEKIKVNKSGLPFSLDSSVKDATAVNIFIGYDINNYLSAELGYLYSGNAYTNNDKFSSRGVTLSAVSYVPITNRLSLILEAGAYRNKTNGLGSSSNNTAPLLGSGISYELTKNLNLQMRWRYFSDITSLSNERKYIGTYSPNENVTTLDFIYHPSALSTFKPIAPPQPLTLNKFSINKDNSKCIHNNSTILFNRNSSYITESGYKELDSIYKYYIEGKNSTCRSIDIIGFADAVGSNIHNLSLSQHRADAVTKYLINLGVPHENIKTEGRGELPYSNVLLTQEKDRRVEVSLKVSK